MHSYELGKLSQCYKGASSFQIPLRPGQALISAQEAAAAGFTLNLLGLTVLNVVACLLSE